MSLIISVDFVFSATKVTLRDNTGDYDATNNPGGYGTPNPAFNIYAHYGIIRKKYAGDTPDVVLTMDPYNPITDTSYPATRTVDGWYEGTKLNILIWTAGTSGIGTVRYYGGNVYIANASTTSTPGTDGTWTPVTDLTTIEDNTSVIATIVGRVTAYNADVYWGELATEKASNDVIGINMDDRQLERFRTIKYNIWAALAADQLGDNLQGEVIVNRLQNLGAK